MAEGFIEIIFFAMVAVFIILRLRSVLGRRNGQERPPKSAFSRAANPEDNVVTLPDRSDEAPGAPEPAPDDSLAAHLARLGAADPTFEPDSFLEGARTAYDLVLTSFASADTDTLRALLDDDVYDDFRRAIQSREQRDDTLETTVVATKSTDIVEASARGRFAEVTVKFVSEIVNVTRDSEGEVVSGNSRDVQDVTDYWTFVRDVKSRDPNWKLVATRSEN